MVGGSYGIDYFGNAQESDGTEVTAETTGGTTDASDDDVDSFEDKLNNWKDGVDEEHDPFNGGFVALDYWTSYQDGTNEVGLDELTDSERKDLFKIILIEDIKHDLISESQDDDDDFL